MKKILLCFLLLAGFASFSQEIDFAKLLNDPNATLQQKQDAFNAYEKAQLKKEKKSEREREREKKENGEAENEEDEGKFGGYAQFKRAEYYMRNHLDENGKVGNPMVRFIEGKKARAQYENHNAQRLNGNNSTQATATWSYIGPSTGVPTGGGAGRLCFIAFDPTTPTTMWVGSPGGGLWKSTNSGTNWTVVNDLLPNLGAAHLAIDPTNTNVMYLSTGDRDGQDNNSVGVLKTTDGGLTWNTTGLIYNVSQGLNANCVLIDPTNTQVLYAATSQGVFKSVDAGVNWINVKVGNFKDVKFKPGDNNTIYACGATLAHSSNAGSTWTNASLPSPNAALGRIAIAVTAADPNIVYALGGEGAGANYGFGGFYKSTNSGATFTKVCSSPNILGWNTTGTDAGGQAWYDLAVAANPTNASEVICGGVNTWKSTNGGASFSLYTHWTGGGGKPYVHADCHAIEYLPGTPSTLYIGCDGGLWKTTNSGSTFAMSSGGLQIGQQYRLGVAQSNVLYTITGWQDNGCSLTNNTSTNYVLGGDGMEAAIDPTTTTVMYGEQYNGNIYKSTNSGSGFFNIVGTGGPTGSVDEDGDWVTPYVIDPSSHLKLYVGKSQVYGSTDGGSTFNAMSTMTGSNKVIALAVAPSNGNYIYAAKSSEVWLSTDGITFNQVTTPGGGITYLCVDPANEHRVWATCGGYSATSKVYYSSDAGTTWSNITGNLPNLPALCIAYGPGSSDGLYVGTDIGVYYKDNTLSNWIFYSNGLPNVIVHELEFHTASNTLRAATYGRGLWEIAAYTAPSSAPTAAFSSNRTNVCYGNTVDFYDNSTNLPISWNWTFTGGSPSSSTLQSPTITYNTPGTYPVKLVVTNQAGADSTLATTYITVMPAPTVTMSHDTTVCKGDSAHLCAFGGTQYQWNPIAGLPNYFRQCPSAAPTVTKTYTCTVNDINGCKGYGSVTVNVIPQPATPTIYTVATQDSLCCNINSGVGYQWYYNGAAMTGETNQCVHITQNGTYSVSVTDTAGCGFSKTSTTFTVSNIGIRSVSSAGGIEVFPNPAQDLINVKFANTQTYQVKIYSAVGEQVFTQSVNANAGTVYPLRLSLAPGAYMVDVSESGKKSLYTRKLIIVE